MSHCSEIIKPTTAIFVMALLLSGCTLPSGEFFVAPDGSDKNPGTIKKPFATIEKARDEIRKVKSHHPDENLVVYFREGTYFLNETVVFGPEDAGLSDRSVTYCSYPGETAVFSSGIQIKHWSLFKDEEGRLAEKAKGNVWVADIPAARTGEINFHVLYDQERICTRAKGEAFTPVNSWPMILPDFKWKDRTEIHFPEGVIKNWENLNDVEIVLRSRNYLPLGSVDESSQIAITKIPASLFVGALGRYAKVSLDDYLNWRQTKNNIWIENVLDVLDQAGEWALDTKKGKLYYWPENGEPGDQIMAPRLTELFRVEGTNVEGLSGDIPVSGLIFKNLTFTCTDRESWTLDEQGIQHNWEMFDKDNAMLRFRAAEACKVLDCTFKNGGGDGIRLDLYCQQINISGNSIYNIGGTGILLAGYGPGIKDVNHHNNVINNHIYNGGIFFKGRPGVFIWQSGENIIANNRIHDFPYNGITISGVRPRFFGVIDPANWLYTTKYDIPRDLRENMRTIRWNEVGTPKTYIDVLKFAHARNNIVQDNEIHDVMQLGGDGNGIYLSSAGEGNIIRRNLIYGSSIGQAWGIRTDDDQHNTLMSENIVIGKAFKLKHTNNRIENNIIIDGADEGVVILTNSPDCRIYRNILINSIHVMKKAYTSHGDESDKVFINNNIYWCDETCNNQQFLLKSRQSEWDKNSLFTNPMFMDFERGDLRLHPDSPAWQLGIQAINTSQIGLLNDPAFERFSRDGFLKSVR